MDKAKLCAHMVRHFQARAGSGKGSAFNRNDAREFLAELQRICQRELAATGRSAVPGIAKLIVEVRRPRRGRNPVTGEPIVIPARRVVRARISGRLREGIETTMRTRDRNG